jgi:hypothetical protein
MQPKEFLASSERAAGFGFASLAVTMLSSIWFAMCLTAREQAWWNDIHWFVLFYAIATILALRGIRSTVGIFVLLLALLPLYLICSLVFGH